MAVVQAPPAAGYQVPLDQRSAFYNDQRNYPVDLNSATIPGNQLYGVANTIPQLDANGNIQQQGQAYAGVAGNRVPQLDANGNLTQQPAPAAAVNSIGQMFGGAGDGVGGALGSIGSALGFGGPGSPESQYTEDQLRQQRIAANAARTASGAIDTGRWKGASVLGNQGQRLGNPAEVMGAQVGARPDLYAQNNPYLRQAGLGASMALTGAAQNQLGARATDFGNTSAFAAGKINQAGNGVRGTQMDTLATAGGQAAQSQRDLGIVRDSAMGKGPSAAENLARSQMDASVRAQAAQAAAARGGNVASANRAAAQGATDTRLQMTSQLAAQRAQEQLNAQQLLTSGNTAVGNQFQGLGSQYGGVRTTDVGQATAAASGMNDAARTAAAQYGIDAQMYGQGMQTQLGAGQQFGAQNLGAQQFEAQNSQQYADWLQKQFSLSMGIPVQYAGQQVQRDIANQQNQTQREGAYAGLIGTGIAALL